MVRLTRALGWMCRVLTAAGWVPWAPAAMAVEPPPEPRLISQVIRIGPAKRQMETLPEFTALWLLPPAVAGRFEETMVAAGFRIEIIAALKDRLVVASQTGEGSIEPDGALLDQFTPSEWTRWLAILATHTGNRLQRWPVAINADVLAALEENPQFARAAGRVRRWSLKWGGRFVFSEVYALEDAFADAGARREFFQTLLSANTHFVKLAGTGPDAEAIAAQSAYWQINGRYRAITPFFDAIAHMAEHDRIDIAHILPRLARSLLYTYPPDFGVVQEPARENGLLAERFFDNDIDGHAGSTGGLSEWLGRECILLEAGAARQYGDMVVFEDLRRTRWPFAVVYVSDGIVFGRRPTLFGPWEFLRADEIPRLNPRLAGETPHVFRRRESLGKVEPPVYVRGRPSAVWTSRRELRDAGNGPWGRLKRYLDVVHLLPPAAREFLNLYVRTSASSPTASCYWTALNFNAERPDSRLLVTPLQIGKQAGIAWDLLQRGYDRIDAPGRLGDIVAYRRKGARGELLHVCAFVAADIAYTKNGFGFHAPWCLMHLDDIDSIYLNEPDVERLTFRLRAVSDAGKT